MILGACVLFGTFSGIYPFPVQLYDCPPGDNSLPSEHDLEAVDRDAVDGEQ